MPALTAIDIVGELTRIYQKGFIKSLRKGDTGIGYTLETTLQIKENNAAEPDFTFKGIPVELKAQRERASSRVTLFTKTPYWDPLSEKEIILRFGYKDKNNRQGLKITLKADEFNEKGFKLNIEKESEKIKIIHKAHGVVAYYSFKELINLLKKKLYENLLLVLADVQRKDDGEYFRYKKALLLKNLDEEAFERLLKEGVIVWEFRAHLKSDGSVRDHGPGFRISKNHITKLYKEHKTIFDASIASEEQK